jgi:hypothetical protein
MRRGTKVETMLKRPWTFVSNMVCMRPESASIAGASYTYCKGDMLVRKVTLVDSLQYYLRANQREYILMPALLNNISSFPPVRVAISALSARMLSALVTSSANVSIPLSSRVERDLIDRAVANTRRPCAANSRARAWPTPPGEHLDSILLWLVYIEPRWSKVE